MKSLHIQIIGRGVRWNSFEDFAKLWAGRPKDEPLPWIVCPIYVFNFNKGQWIPRPV